MNQLAPSNEILPPVNKAEVKDAIKKIQASWTKTINALIETSKLLYDYQLSPDWTTISSQLDEEKIIDKSVQQMLIGIGGNPTLTDDRYREFLPPHYNNLAYLSRIKGKQLVKLFNDKEITSATTLKDAKDLASKFGSLKKPQKPRNTDGKPQKVGFQITVDAEYDPQTVIQEIVEFIEQFEGVTVKVN